MVTNQKHLSEGPVVFTLKSGVKLMGELRFNDPISEVFWLELEEGYFEPLPYSEFESAVRLASLKSKRYDA